MATKTLTGTYVRGFSSDGYYVNYPYFGRIYNANANTTCTICFKLTLPQGRVNKLTFTIGVKNILAGTSISGSQYGIKLSTSDISNPMLTDGILSLNGTVSSNGYGTITGTISADKLTDYSGKTIYVYLGATDTLRWSAVSLQSLDINMPASDVSVIAEYAEYTNVTSPSISTDYEIIKPTKDITIKWSGAANGMNNNISSLVLILRKSSPSGTILYQKTGIASNDTDLTITNNDWAANTVRGDKIYATIQAIGTVSGFDGIKNSKLVATINQLPTAPLVTASGATINANTNITFTVTKGTDPDGQATTVYYKIGNSDKTQLSGNTLTYDINSGLSGGSNTINFFTRDALGEESGSTSKSFNVIYKPKIASINANTILVKSGASEKETLAIGLDILYTLAQDLTDISFEFSTGGTDNTVILLNHKVNTITKTINIDVLSSAELPRGEKCSLYIRPISNNQKGDWELLAQNIIRPKEPEKVVISYNGIVGPYFNNNIALNLIAPSAENAVPDIISIKVRAEYGSGLKDLSISNPNEGESYAPVLSLNVPAKTNVKITAILTDAAGQTSISDTLNLIQAAPPNFAAGVISLNPDPVKPLSGDEIIISHPVAESVPAQSIKYTYIVGDKSLTTKDNGSTGDGVIVVTTNLEKDLEDIKENKSKQISVVVQAEDELGNTASLSATLTVDFRESPILKGVFTIKHDFAIGASEVNQDIGMVIEGKNNSSTRMFNPGESVIFCIPETMDVNGDVTEYQIFMDRQTAAISGPSDDSWTISTSPILIIEASNTYAKYVIPATSKNEYLRFRIRAKDSTNLFSNVLTSTYITRCRVVAPIFMIDNVNISGSTLTYDFSLKDLGGSADGLYAKVYYNYFKNLERDFSVNGTKYSKTMRLSVDISEASDYSNKDTYILTTVNTDGNFSDFTSSGKTLTKSYDAAKLYLKFTLTISYGLDSNGALKYITSLPLDIIYYGSVPTVSHRAHHIGINTNTFDDNEVLAISSHEDHYIVALKGEKTVTINLRDGTINGIIIDCGVW